MTTNWDPLRAGEHELDNDELLWRVAGKFAVNDAGQPIPALFRLTPTDAGRLSVARDTRTTPAAAVAHRHSLTGKAQIGAWAVMVSEVQELQLRTVDDSETQPPPDAPGHAYIDKRPILTNKDAIVAARGELLTLAIRHEKANRVYRA